MGLFILNIDSLIGDFENSFYTEPLMFLLNIIFLLMGLKSGPIEKKYKVLLLYGLVALLQNMLTVFISLSYHTPWQPKNEAFIIDVSIIIFILVEFFAFFTFFYYQFEGQPLRKGIKRTREIFAVLGILTAAYLVAFAGGKNLRLVMGYFSVVLSIVQLVPAFYYFYILFNEPPVKNLLREPAFWITTGIAFVHGLNIPLLLAQNYVIPRYESLWSSLYTINFVAYSFLYLLFIISMNCEISIRHKESNNRVAKRLNSLT